MEIPVTQASKGCIPCHSHCQSV